MRMIYDVYCFIVPYNNISDKLFKTFWGIAGGTYYMVAQILLRTCKEKQVVVEREKEKNPILRLQLM